MKKTVFKNEDISLFCSGVGVSGLTKDAAALFLHELVKRTGGQFLLQIEEEGGVFDLYSRSLEVGATSFVYLPATPSSGLVPGFVPEEERYQKEAILSLVSKKPILCFGTKQAFESKMVSKNIKKEIKKFVFGLGKTVPLEKVLSALRKLDYKKKETVTEAGCFSVRGDILDVFPQHFKNPARISFNHEKIEKISLFDPLSQLTIQNLKKLIFDDHTDSYVANNIGFVDFFHEKTMFYGTIKNDMFSFRNKSTIKETNLKTSDLFPVFNSKKEKIKTIEKLEKNVKTIFFVGTASYLQKQALQFKYSIIPGSIEKSFLLKSSDSLVLSENEIFSKEVHQRKWQPRTTDKNFLTYGGVLSDIKKGDLVVHRDFGIGLFCGIIQKRETVWVSEGIEIEYKNNSRVFVSSEQLYLVQRYVGSGKKPGLSTLGTKRWSSELKKAKKEASEVAKEIVVLYSKKTQPRSFSFTKTNDLDNVLARSFSFVETPDQKKAIKDIYQDMNKKTPMDRLVCGDVGFGKTEVAIRAVFKSFLSDKLSVLLCPTTILANQHYISCTERLGVFGVRVSLLSRFKSKKKQNETLSFLKEKKIDVLIGTHRILSKDVKLKNLGLLIIDEEHRFGVKHKEKIRTLKTKTDVLTMTATPIPRTLQQSLVGLKSLSVIKTPPVSRKPIATAIKYFNWASIRQTINAELLRRGQVYFLNNNINSIPSYVEKIKSLFPKHVVAGASGKMESRALEKIVLSFFSGEIDILVCTTIIESGLDVTNANSIIVNNAQNFGLPQLYQIRGRVGRGAKQARCLLLVPNKPLEKDAYKRLKTIEQNTALGAGYNISMKDLEIRGSGSLFGYRQSGHISSVGFELYCDLLREEINKNTSGSTSKNVQIITPELPRFDRGYIKTTTQRLDYYYKIAKTTSTEEVCIIKNELKDAFGKPPIKTITLLNIAKLKHLYSKTPIEKIVFSGRDVSFYLKTAHPFQSLEDLLVSVSNFSHKELIEYRYKKESGGVFLICLTTKNQFPRMNVLFSFINLFTAIT